MKLPMYQTLPEASAFCLSSRRCGDPKNVIYPKNTIMSENPVAKKMKHFPVLERVLYIFHFSRLKSTFI